MELMTRGIVFPHPARVGFGVKLPLYLRIMLATLVSISVITLGVYALAQQMEQPSNPFSPYVDIFLGQPQSAVVAQGFSCAMYFNGGYYSGLDDYCTLKLAQGAVSSIGVLISQDVGRQITFGLRENTLRLGDLVALWGRPNVHQYGPSVSFSWRRIGVTTLTLTYTRPFSLFIPVRSIYFVGPPT